MSLVSPRETEEDRPGRESRFAVLAAMAANIAIAAGKLIAGLITGSAALLAEAGHSLADTADQVFLLLGLNLSNTRADESHPHGYGKEAFFWSFLAAILIFVGGATFSFYEGIRTAIGDHAHARSASQLIIAFGVLGMAALFESSSFLVAVRSLRAGARRRQRRFFDHIRRSPDLTTKTVFFEDSAALTGLALAVVGLALAEITGDEIWDALASIGIGFVLAAVSIMLGMQSRALLLGAAAPLETRQKIRHVLASFPEVDHVVRLLTMMLGAQSVLVTGELELRRGLTTEEIEQLIGRIDESVAETAPEVSDTFWELRSRSPVPAEAPARGERVEP